ncbi:hypothetical protein TNCT_441561 [Trichonephila clavata]|uniref:Uncharacterized protein n=1 Tax=Trichonephila clavata TaxID=2740835 RepID=A0A8X6HFU5_TRICU|nr:hypothetical protein TNCT_441561 [Trichonephila clavata]
MGYRCDHCNLEFIDFEQYIDHESKAYNELLLKQMTCNKAWTLEKLFHMCKTASESHMGNISLNEENNTYMRTDTPLEVGSLHCDSDEYNANQLRHETLNEKVTSLTGFDDFDPYVQTQFAAQERNPEVNFNQPSTSSAQRQMSGMNAKINTNSLLVSAELSQEQLFNCEIKQFHNTNQDSLPADYNPMEHQMQEMNPEFNRYQPFVSSDHSLSEFVSFEMNQHLDRNQLSLSPQHNEIEFYPHEENPKLHNPFTKSKYSQVQLDRHEMNPQFDTNEPTASSLYSQMEYYNKERIPQFDRNPQIVSSSNSEIKNCWQERNLRFDRNQPNVSFGYSHTNIVTKKGIHRSIQTT